MPQQQLNGADVRAGFQQVHGEGVSERMRRHRLRETAATTGLAAGAVDDPARRRALGVMTGKEPVLRLADSPPVAQHRQQRRGEHHIPVPLPFPLDDAEHHPLAVNRRHGQAHGFRDAKARGIAGRQDGAMLGVLYAVEQPHHLGRAEHDG